MQQISCHSRRLAACGHKHPSQARKACSWMIWSSGGGALSAVCPAAGEPGLRAVGTTAQPYTAGRPTPPRLPSVFWRPTPPRLPSVFWRDLRSVAILRTASLLSGNSVLRAGFFRRRWTLRCNSFAICCCSAVCVVWNLPLTEPGLRGPTPPRLPSVFWRDLRSVAILRTASLLSGNSVLHAGFFRRRLTPPRLPSVFQRFCAERARGEPSAELPGAPRSACQAAVVHDRRGRRET